MPTYVKGPAQIIIDPSGVNITINRDQQLNDATVNFILDTSPLNALSSSQPLDLIQIGAAVQIVISVADFDLKNQLFALAYNTTVVGSGSAKKVLVQDLAGTKVAGKMVILKPYDGLTPTSDANQWITLPNAKISTMDGTNLAYGLQTQAVMQFTFMSMADSNGVKAIIGDMLAV